MNIKPMTIIFIGAIVAVVGGLLSAFGTFKQNKSSSSRMSSIQTKAEEIGKQSERQLKEINNLNRQNAFLQLNVDSLNNKADEQVKTIVELSKQNSELAKQLANSTKIIHDNITGGDSFCEIYISPNSGDSARIEAIHHGTATVYDLGIKLTDVEVFRKLKKNGKDGFKDAQLSMTLGNVSPRTVMSMGILTSDFSTSFKQFNIQFSSRNDSYFQVLKLFKKGDTWIRATRIKSLSSDKIIYEEIDQSFPIEHLNW